MVSHIVTRRCAGEILPYSWQGARQQREEDSGFAFATMPRGAGGMQKSADMLLGAIHALLAVGIRLL